MAGTAQEMKGGRLPLFLVSVAHGVNHVYQLAPSIISLKIGLEYSLSTFQAGLLLLAFNLPYAIFQAFFGALSRKLGTKRLIVGGLFVSGMAFSAASLAPGVVPLGIVLFLAGTGCSSYHPLGIPLISGLFQVRRGEALGYHQTGGSIGSFVAPLIVGIVMEIWGWRLASLTLSLLGLSWVPFLWYRLSDSKVSAMEGPGISISELRYPLLLVLAAAFYVVPFRGLQLFGIYYFDEGKRLGTQAYLLMSLSNVAGMFSGPVCGRLSDFLDRKKVILSLVLVEGASAFGLVLFTGIPLYLIVVVLGFAFYGLLATTDAFISDVMGPRLFGTIIGVNMTASFVVSTILSPTLGSSIAAIGYDPSFNVLATLSLASVPLILFVRRPERRQRPRSIHQERRDLSRHC